MELLFALVIKHVIVDLGLQSQLLWGLTHNKKRYFGCHAHYFHHGLGTLIVALFFTSPLVATIAAVIDYIAHWHIDYTKHNTINYLELKRQDKLFWWVTVVDQLLHFLTYYLLVLYVIN